MLRELQDQIKQLKAMLSGQMPPDMAAIAGGSAGSSPAKDEGRRRASASQASNAEFREQMEREKAAEIAAVEERLKADYEAKLASIESKAGAPGVSDEALEKELIQVEEEYENSRATATAAIISKVDASELAVEDFDGNGGGGGGAKKVRRSSAPSLRPATVLDAGGNPVVALQAADGTFLKATLSEDGQLQPVLGSDGSPVTVVGLGGAPAQEIGASDGGSGGTSAGGATSPMSVMRFVPTTVIGVDGTPIAALIGPDGQAVRAVINELGQLEPALDANGDYDYLEGPEGQSAVEVHQVNEPVTVLGPDGNMSIAVYDENGQAVKAVLGADGEVHAARDKKGRTQMVQNDAAAASLHAEPIIDELVVRQPIVVTGPDGKPAVALLSSDGMIVKAKLSGSGVTAVMKSGKVVKMDGPKGSACRRVPAATTPVVVVGRNGKPQIAIVGPDGTFCQAELDADDNQIKISLDGSQAPIKVLGPDGKPAQEIISAATLSTGEKVKIHASMAAVAADGSLVAAAKGPDGIPVEATVSANGMLQPKVGPTGETKPILGPSGDITPISVPEAPVAILTPDGKPGVAILNADGQIVKAATGLDGQLHAELEDGWPVEIEGAKLLEVSAHTVSRTMPKLIAVIGKDGKPVPAIMGPNGIPIVAHVAESGRVEAVRAADGSFEVVQGPTGAQAVPIKMQAQPKLVAGTAGTAPVVAVEIDGQLVKAEMGKDGKLVPMTNAAGQVEVVGEDGQEISSKKVAAMAIPKSNSVVVVNEGGQAVPAQVQPDGTHVRMHMGKAGKLVAMLDRNGKKVKMRKGGPKKMLKTITEEHDESALMEEEEEEPSGQRSPTASRMLSPVDDPQLAAELMAKLQMLQAATVQADEGNTAGNAEIKEEMKNKKDRAERKRLARLRKAAENADDDGILEGIYENLTGEVKIGREKLSKAKELIKSARQETKDMNEEFERDREMMLDDMRKQNQQLKFQQAVIDRIVPLIRRDCNYFNIDKIRAIAKWDDERQDWLMPRVSTSGASGSGAPHGARPAPSLTGQSSPRNGSGGGGGSRSGSGRRTRSGSDDPEDERLRQRLASNGQDPSKYFESQRAREMLMTMEHREAQIAEQMQSRLARFDNAVPRQSARSQQLLAQGGGSPSLQRHGKGRRNVGGPMQSGALNPVRSPRAGPRKTFTANDWLKKP